MKKYKLWLKFLCSYSDRWTKLKEVSDLYGTSRVTNVNDLTHVNYVYRDCKCFTKKPNVHIYKARFRACERYKHRHSEQLRTIQKNTVTTDNHTTCIEASRLTHAASHAQIPLTAPPIKTIHKAPVRKPRSRHLARPL